MIIEGHLEVSVHAEVFSHQAIMDTVTKKTANVQFDNTNKDFDSSFIKALLSKKRFVQYSLKTIMDFVTKKTAHIQFDKKIKDFEGSDIFFTKWQSWTPSPRKLQTFNLTIQI